jgi:site-specific DNA-adenine methylase
MEGVTFATHDYAATPITDKAVVYCDPPYTKTSGYKFGAFDHSDFIAWVERIVEERNAVVFVSEFAVIDRVRWQLVWAKTRQLKLHCKSNNVRQERLYRVAQQPSNDGLFTHTP